MNARYRNPLELAKAVRERWPDIKLVAAVEHTAYLDPKARERSWARIAKANADAADEHMYGSPSWWLNNARMYDAYPRTGVDVYVGEWATRNASDPYINSMYNAVCEAAFRMGFERNADLVRMSTPHRSSYQSGYRRAPLTYGHHEASDQSPQSMKMPNFASTNHSGHGWVSIEAPVALYFPAAFVASTLSICLFARAIVSAEWSRAISRRLFG